jgi:hypothetical protein
MLRGRIITPGGQPVAGATVTIAESVFYGKTGASMHLQPVSGADGVFTLAEISPTLELSFISATKAGYQYVSGGKVTDGAEPAITDIVLAPRRRCPRSCASSAF